MRAVDRRSKMLPVAGARQSLLPCENCFCAEAPCGLCKLSLSSLQVVFVVIAVFLWFTYNRILLPLADRFEQV